MEILIFDIDIPHQPLSAMISPFEFTQRHSSEGCLFTSGKTSLVLMAVFRAGLAGLNHGYPENPALKPRKPSLLGSLIFSYVGLSWVSWVLKNYELGLGGLAGF